MGGENNESVSSRGRGGWTTWEVVGVVVGGMVCVLAVGWAIQLVVASASPLPWVDQWDVVREHEALVHGEFGWQELFSPHNEHRMALARIVYFADLYLVGGSNALNLAVILAFLAVHAVLLVALFRSITGSRIGTSMAAAAVAIVLFSPAQAENLVWGFQVQFVAVYALASIAFVLVIEGQRREIPGAGDRWLGGSLVAAVAAPLMMANGLIVAPLVFVLGAVTRIGRQRLVLVAVCTVLLWLVYLWGLEPVVAQGDGSQAIGLFGYLDYLVVLLGNIAAVDGGGIGASLARALGTCGVVLTCVLAWRMLFVSEPDERRLVLVAVALFAALSAAAITVGRARYGVAQAFSPRYRAVAGIFWVGHMLYWTTLPVTTRLGRPRRAIAIAACAGIVVASTVISVRMLPWYESFRNRMALASDALVTGVHDGRALGFALPAALHDALLWEGDAFLRARGLAMYARPEASVLGTDLEKPIRGDATCVGWIDIVQEVEGQHGGLAVQGWGWNVTKEEPVGRILLVGSDGKVVGLASTGWDRSDVPPVIPYVTDPAVGWRGFFERPASPEVTAYAVDDALGIVCRVASR